MIPALKSYRYIIFIESSYRSHEYSQYGRAVQQQGKVERINGSAIVCL